ncbi:hypothetical protein LXA43DRAFT_522067 [Ganoderma leucocontextum]|nr:hypothetical protein LXA43DRAFT_522067 [Ganoderma leucocontextum]
MSTDHGTVCRTQIGFFRSVLSGCTYSIRESLQYLGCTVGRNVTPRWPAYRSREKRQAELEASTTRLVFAATRMAGRGLGRRAQISIHSKAWLWRPPHAYSTLGPSCRMVLSRIIHYNLLQCVSIDGVHVSGMSTVKLPDPPMGRRFQHFAGWDCAQLCFDDDLEEVHFTASVSKQPFLVSMWLSPPQLLQTISWGRFPKFPSRWSSNGLLHLLINEIIAAAALGWSATYVYLSSIVRADR